MKIAPAYKSPVVHVLDASKSVVVCSALLATDDQRDDFLDAVREDYEEIRSDYYESVKDKKYVTLAESRKRKYKLDWTEFEPVRPTFLGRRVLHNYDLRKLVSYIDWKPFFDTWQLRGKYPNRGYPKIFNDETVGAEAKRLFQDANALLDKFIGDNSLTADAVCSFHPCQANDSDDILIYEDESAATTVDTLHGLRQQVRHVTF